MSPLASPNYDKLRDISELSYMDNDTHVFNSARQEYIDLQSKVDGIKALLAEGLDGEAHAAIEEWLTRYKGDLDSCAARSEHYVKCHDDARAIMQEAVSTYRGLSPQLVDHETEKQVRIAFPVVAVEGANYTADAYLDELRRQANEARERAAAQALSVMNFGLKMKAGDVTREGTNVNTPAPASSGALSAGLLAGAAAGAGLRGGRFSAGAYAGGAIGTYAAGSALAGTGAVLHNRAVTSGPNGPGSPGVPNGSVASGGTGSYRRPPATGPGSRHEPINDPGALRHLDLYQTPINQRMTSDGPRGGYIPASVLDMDDPRWTSGAAASAGSRDMSTRAGMLVGGTLGGGGAFGMRAGGAGLAGLGLTGAASRLGGRVPGTGVLHNGVAGDVAGVTGSGGAAGGVSAAAARGGLSAGSLSAGGGAAGSASAATGNAAMAGNAAAASGNAAASGTAARGAAGSGVAGRAGMMPMGAAGAGAGDREERRSGRVGYSVVRIDDEVSSPTVVSEGMKAGSADLLKPLSLGDDDGDTWE